MRLGRFDENGPQACLRHDDRALHLAAVDGDMPAELLDIVADKDAMRRLSLLERGQPPAEHRRHMDKLAMLPPVEPKRVLLRGGVNEEFTPSVVRGAGADIPAGTWHTGVAAVVGNKGKVAGWTVFHRVGDVLCLGTWLVTPDEAGDPIGFLFSAFVDDLPSIRPVKALLDWQAEIDRASPKLRPGDIIALCAPPQDGGADIRSSLASDGRVLCRLEAHQR